ncbi:MAG TPA: NAD-dependent epimerase/dehydratase family protein [Aquihabitans sp.]|nr:NAD-dependent epimerase/dehydratase family protein [Aquihabitans sp.]
MRVVVTGAAGFIGSHLVDALLADGHDVVGIDCFTDYYARADKEANLAGARAHDAFRFVEADLRVDPLETLLDGADAVVNEAATPGLVLSWEDFERYQSCNLSAVKRLVDACLATGVGHLVQASTSSVYGAEATGAEEASTLPVSPYGVTKLAAEHLLRAHTETFGLPLTILRYFSIYGPRQRPDMAYRIFAERLLAGAPITVYGDGRQSRSNTYVTDCVAATIAALHRPATGEIYNIGGGRELELLEAIGLIADALGVAPELRFEPARRGDQRRTAAITDRARHELGWQPHVEPAEGLAAEVAWLRGRSQP